MGADRQRFRLSFRAKLLAGQVALLALVVGLVMIWLERTLADDLRAGATERLELQAQGAKVWAERARHPQQLAERLGAVIGARVTVADHEGVSLADTDKAPPAEDLRRQPEMVAALEGRTGRDVRAGQGGDVAFVAVRASDEVLLRLALPLGDVERTIADMQKRLIAAAFAGLVGAIALAALLSRVVGRPLLVMRDAARRIAAGDVDVKLPPRTPDELGELSVALGELSRQLRIDADRIARLQVMRQDFVANLSHEIRTPLAALSGFAETLTQTDQPPETQKKALFAIERHAKRLSTLASGLLRLSEIEAQDPEDLSKEPVDLAPLARHVAASAERRRGREGAVLVDVGSGVSPLADPLALEQVLDNLVDNAMLHAGPDAKVRIASERDGDHVVVRVSDDGVGVAAEHLPRLFDRFYRAEKTKSRDPNGSGLGLAIVKHLVEAMGGTIDVTSEVSKGTRFEVRLPAAAERDPKA